MSLPSLVDIFTHPEESFDVPRDNPIFQDAPGACLPFDVDANPHTNTPRRLRLAAKGALNALIHMFRYARPEVLTRFIDEAGVGTQKESSRGIHPDVSQSFVQFAGRSRGCRRGFCCVYSMWYDSNYKCVRNCEHRCHLSRGGFAHCGPSLLEACDLARDFAEFASRNPRRFELRSDVCTPLVLSKRRTTRKHLPRQESNFAPETPLPPHEARHYDPVPLVAVCHSKPKRRRNPHSSASISRIRKCMGSLAFGKLNKTRPKKIPVVSLGVETSLCGGGVPGTGVYHGRTSDQKQEEPQATDASSNALD